MKLLCAALVLVAVVATRAQNYGQYRATPAYRAINDGRWVWESDFFFFFHSLKHSLSVPKNKFRYNGLNDGQYHPDNSGQYSGDNGAYHHQDVKYVHIVGGQGGQGGFGGSGGNVRYTPTPTAAPAPAPAPRKIVQQPAQPPTGWRIIQWNKDIDTAGYHYL